jgi:hypothetical protein
MSTPHASHDPAGPPSAPTTPSGSVTDLGAAPYAPSDAVPGGLAPVPARRSGLALAAFVVGLVSILVCLIPVVNVVSIVGGLVAVVLAVLALRKLAPGITGKGFAITGLVLGAVSVVVAVLMLVAIGAAVKTLDDSGELDAILEEVEAAQEGTPAEEPEALPSDAAVEAPADAAAPAPAEAGAADVVREDFSDITCDVVREEAIALAQESPEEGAPVLVDILDSVPVEDHRADYALPTGTDESLLLSCRGMAAWDDASQSPILTEVTLDGAGNLYVGAAAE